MATEPWTCGWANDYLQQRPHFPHFCCGWVGRMARFSLMGCQQKWYVHLPGNILKGQKYDFYFFPAFSWNIVVKTWARGVTGDQKVTLEIKATHNEARIGVWASESPRPLLHSLLIFWGKIFFLFFKPLLSWKQGYLRQWWGEIPWTWAPCYNWLLLLLSARLPCLPLLTGTLLVSFEEWPASPSLSGAVNEVAHLPLTWSIWSSRENGIWILV